MFFLARLLQRFDGLQLALDAFPPNGRPSPEWGVAGRAGKEQFVMRSTITMHAQGGMWIRLHEAKEFGEGI